MWLWHEHTVFYDFSLEDQFNASLVHIWGCFLFFLEFSVMLWQSRKGKVLLSGQTRRVYLVEMSVSNQRYKSILGHLIGSRSYHLDKLIRSYVLRHWLCKSVCIFLDKQNEQTKQMHKVLSWCCYAPQKSLWDPNFLMDTKFFLDPKFFALKILFGFRFCGPNCFGP